LDSSGRNEKYNILFSICGQVNICKELVQLTGNASEYQSCQAYGIYVIQTGIPSLLSSTPSINDNGITLSYSSNISYSGCARTNQIVLTCDENTDFEITQTTTPASCVYSIHISSRFACCLKTIGDNSTSSSSQGQGSTSLSSSENSSSSSSSSSLSLSSSSSSNTTSSESSTSTEIPTTPQCIVNGLNNNTYYNLSSLVLPNHQHYQVIIGNNSDTLLFSVCGVKLVFVNN